MSDDIKADPSFNPTSNDLKRSTEILVQWLSRERSEQAKNLPNQLPRVGMGDRAALEWLGPLLISGSKNLGGPISASHMDPPTPWITWAVAMWKAALNQNLLHESTSPFSRMAEDRVVHWLCPYFAMGGGQMTAGSTLGNLTALWAAKRLKNVKRVIASDQSHLSVKKAALILDLAYQEVKTELDGKMRLKSLAGSQDLSDAVLVLTAGTTSSGAIDEFFQPERCGWIHVDAAWAGPLRLSSRYTSRLDGIDKANSVVVSAHKWLFQPKDSAFVFFKDWDGAKSATSLSGSYLTTPNVGIMGSKSAMAEPLLATLMSWGSEGLENRIDRCMRFAEQLAEQIQKTPHLELRAEPESGVVVWRPRNELSEKRQFLLSQLCSTTRINDQLWFRNVAANPSVDFSEFWKCISEFTLEES
jgi:L-2,4-diaminobutyrate decarboxylase